MQLRAVIAIVGIPAVVLSFALGASFTAYQDADDLEKIVIPLLSMLGGWVSGLGALAAVFTALHIASRQSEELRINSTIKCVHHAIAIVEDLRSRVSYQRKIIFQGGAPLSALTANALAIDRRHETLYDREIYQFMPADIIDKISGLGGSVFGLCALSTAIASSLNNESHALVTVAATLTSKQEDDVESLVRELHQLAELLSNFRKLLSA